MIKKTAMIVAVTALSLTGCSRERQEPTQNLFEQAAESVSTDTAAKTHRVFVTVVDKDDTGIWMNDTSGTRYKASLDYDKGYNTGALLCLVYEDSTEQEDGSLYVEPVQLYPNDNRTDIPRF